MTVGGLSGRDKSRACEQADEHRHEATAIEHYPHAQSNFISRKSSWALPVPKL